MARRTLLIIASILLAALGTALIWLYVQGAEARARVGLVQVYVLRGAAAAGTAATALQIGPAWVPTEVAADAVTSPSQLGAQKLTVQAVAGQLLLRSMLGTAASAAGERFPAGGAAAITISDPNRVPRELRVGDSVDVVELAKNKAQVVKDLTNVTVRTIGSSATSGAATGAAAAGAAASGATASGATASGATASGANGAGQNGGIPPTIVGLDVTSKQALALYSIVARGGQMALYLHNPPSR